MSHRIQRLMSKRIFVVLSVLGIYSLLAMVQITLVETANINILVVMAGVIIANIWTVNAVIKNGFLAFKGTKTADIAYSICYGLTCYLCLLSQIALIFFFYYIYYDGHGVVPVHVASEFIEGRTDFVTDFRIVLNYVFPNFYKFPTAQGIMVVIQFYIGKFTDLFILAFIVDQIKKHVTPNPGGQKIT